MDGQPFLKQITKIFGLWRGPVVVLPVLLLLAAMQVGAVEPGMEEVGSGPSFATFKASGLERCTGEDGKPTVLMFSSSTCSHCEWSGEIFDFLVKYYVATGKINAHHYDIHTGDDLLTKEVETEIPVAYLDLKARGNPEGFIPYFNFGCEYERIGNGYERKNDVAAEAAEMRQVIEAITE